MIDEKNIMYVINSDGIVHVWKDMSIHGKNMY